MLVPYDYNNWRMSATTIPSSNFGLHGLPYFSQEYSGPIAIRISTLLRVSVHRPCVAYLLCRTYFPFDERAHKLPDFITQTHRQQQIIIRVVAILYREDPPNILECNQYAQDRSQTCVTLFGRTTDKDHLNLEPQGQLPEDKRVSIQINVQIDRSIVEEHG